MNTQSLLNSGLGSRTSPAGKRPGAAAWSRLHELTAAGQLTSRAVGNLAALEVDLHLACLLYTSDAADE